MTELVLGPLDPWSGRDVGFDDASDLEHPSGSVEAIRFERLVEHLTPAAVTRLLLESFRVLRHDGRLELTMPSYARVLDAWRSGDPRASEPGAWDCLRRARGWAARGVVDDLDQRTSAIFCTFDADGYRGPAVVDPTLVRTILATKTPFRAAVDLRRAVIDAEPRFRFCRQNAYAAEEIARALRVAGFAATIDDGPGEVRVVARPVAADARLVRGSELFRAGRDEDAIAEYQAAVAARPELAAEHYRLFYYVYIQAVRRRLGSRAPDDAFERFGHRTGQLDRAGVDRLVASIARAPRAKLAIEDYAPGFVHNPDLNDRDLGEINASHAFVVLREEQLELIAPLLDELRAPLESCLRAPFQVVNVRCWTTHPRGIATQTNDWHNDEGFPADVLKVMVYLSGAGTRIGSTEVALPTGEKLVVEGPPGTFLIFKNYPLTHRGVMPLEGERLVLEISVVPSFTSRTRPVFAGLNAEFPEVPW